MTRDLRARALKVSAIAIVGMVGFGADGTRAEPLWMAQAYPRPPAPIEMMPPHEVRTIVRSTGLTPAGPPVRRGDLYIQPALDPYGRPMRVVVDADAGAVVSIRPAPATGAGPHPTGPYPRYGAVPPRYLDDDEDDLVPPRPVPNGRAPMVGERAAPFGGERTATRNPATTPVPRPRPATAPRDPAVAAVKPAPDPASTASVPQAKPEPAPEAATPAAAPPAAAAPADTNAFPPVQPLE